MKSHVGYVIANNIQWYCFITVVPQNLWLLELVTAQQCHPPIKKKKEINPSLSIAEKRLKLQSSKFRKQIKNTSPSLIHTEIYINTYRLFL